MECFVANRTIAPAEIGVDFQRSGKTPRVILRGHLSSLELLAASKGLLEAPEKDLVRTLRALRKDAAEPLLAALFSGAGGQPRYVLRSLDELRGLDHRIVFSASADVLT